MFSGENGRHPISGGAVRMYANGKFMDRRELMRMQLDMVRNRYTAAAWAKRADTGSDEDMPRDYQLFTYVTHLLGYEPDAPRDCGGAYHISSAAFEFPDPARQSPYPPRYRTGNSVTAPCCCSRLRKARTSISCTDFALRAAVCAATPAAWPRAMKTGSIRMVP